MHSISHLNIKHNILYKKHLILLSSSFPGNVSMTSKYAKRISIKRIYEWPYWKYACCISALLRKYNINLVYVCWGTICIFVFWLPDFPVYFCTTKNLEILFVYYVYFCLLHHIMLKNNNNLGIVYLLNNWEEL